MKRGRPKGRSRDSRSFGPLGDLIRKFRLDKGLGLSDVAKACQCSVQFISNIEHGRAPLPWEKVGPLSNYLKIPVEELQAANLAIRSDFKSFVKTTKGKGGPKSVKTPGILLGMTGAASAGAMTAKDAALQEILQKYQAATLANRKKFVKEALKTLAS
ncbi:MAG: helix-turn-helix domain-containing protein [Methylotenera sp.]|nr:helix-turn-helix domain-containing protein [Oligoflexia bacterium]